MKAIEHEPRCDDPMPSLEMRVDNIGHRNPRMSGIAPESAATVYLDSAIEKLDAVPGRRLPEQGLQENTCNPLTFQPRTFISSLVRRVNRQHTAPVSPAADNQTHITNPQ